jgi:hypothetical protein
MKLSVVILISLCLSIGTASADALTKAMQQEYRNTLLEDGFSADAGKDIVTVGFMATMNAVCGDEYQSMKNVVGALEDHAKKRGIPTLIFAKKVG